MFDKYLCEMNLSRGMRIGGSIILILTREVMAGVSMWSSKDGDALRQREKEREREREWARAHADVWWLSLRYGLRCTLRFFASLLVLLCLLQAEKG